MHRPDQVRHDLGAISIPRRDATARMGSRRQSNQSTPSSFDIDVTALRRKGKSSQTQSHELCDGVEHAKMTRLFNKKVAGTVGNLVPLSQADRDSVKGSHSNTRALFLFSLLVTIAFATEDFP